MLKVPSFSPTVAAGNYPGIPAGEIDSAAATGELLVYRVRRGDTLSGIARRYRTTASAIAATRTSARVTHAHATTFVFLFMSM